MEKVKSSDQSGIAEAMMKALKYSGIDKQNLAELVQIASGAVKAGIRFTGVGPIGIPYPDGIKVETQLGSQQLSEVVQLLAVTPRVNSVKIFPIGIPAVDSFVTEVEYR
jgi:hypothetical protein